jgi:hypothetical protein
MDCGECAGRADAAAATDLPLDPDPTGEPQIYHPASRKYAKCLDLIC